MIDELFFSSALHAANEQSLHNQILSENTVVQTCFIISTLLIAVP